MTHRHDFSALCHGQEQWRRVLLLPNLFTKAIKKYYPLSPPTPPFQIPVKKKGKGSGWLASAAIRAHIIHP